MECNIHNNIANSLCMSCGKALCSDCKTYKTTTRTGCSEECLNNLKNIDEAALISITKAQKSLTANVMFCRLLGVVFILIGIFMFFYDRNDLFSFGFLTVMGLAFVIGSQIYASALKDKKL